MTRPTSDAAYERAVKWDEDDSCPKFLVALGKRGVREGRDIVQIQRVLSFVAGYLAATSAAQRGGKRGKKGKRK